MKHAIAVCLAVLFRGVAAASRPQAGVPSDRAPLKKIHTTTEGDTIGEGSVVQVIGLLTN
jgi:hypothetical protein